MKPDLCLFSRIVAHLEYLTTYDEHGTKRSREVENYEDLANELNRVGIVPNAGAWTKRALDSFVPRIKDRYSPEQIQEACDCRFIGASSWECLSATTAGELMAPRRMLHYQRDPEYSAEPVRRYKPIEGESWKQHEEPELFREAAAIKRSAKAKNYSDRVRINRFIA